MYTTDPLSCLSSAQMGFTLSAKTMVLGFFFLRPWSYIEFLYRSPDYYVQIEKKRNENQIFIA